MSEKHATHAHGHPAGADEKKAGHEAHRERFDHAVKTVANGMQTFKDCGCTPAEAQRLAVELWEKTKAG